MTTTITVVDTQTITSSVNDMCEYIELSTEIEDHFLGQWLFSDNTEMTVDWGDGSSLESHRTTLTHHYADTSRKLVTLGCPDLSKLIYLNVAENVCVLEFPSLSNCENIEEVQIFVNSFDGVLPSFSACTKLETFEASSNDFSGSLPSFNACTLLDYFAIDYSNLSGNLPSFSNCVNLTSWSCYSNSLSGTIPSFNTCTLLEYAWFSINSFSGTLPDFSDCTKLKQIFFDENQLTGYTAGSFATQKDLNYLAMNINSLTEGAVDAILEDLVTSLSIPGRVGCSVYLQDGNAVPSAAGLADKATLNGTSGWLVITEV